MGLASHEYVEIIKESMLAQLYGYVGVDKGALPILECTAKVHENMQMPRCHSKSIGCLVTID